MVFEIEPFCGSHRAGPSTDSDTCYLEFRPVDRQVGTDLQPLLGRWVFEFQALAVQCNALWETFVGSIEAVPEDRTIDGRQLAPDLVLAPCDQTDAKQRVFRCTGENSILEDRLLSFGMIRSDKARDGILRATQQGLIEASFDR